MKRKPLNLKTILPPAIRILNQKPLSIPGGAIPIKIILVGRLLSVLIPANKLNILPKGLPFDVYGDFVMDDNFEVNCGLITREGKTYYWGTSIG